MAIYLAISGGNVASAFLIEDQIWQWTVAAGGFGAALGRTWVEPRLKKILVAAFAVPLALALVPWVEPAWSGVLVGLTVLFYEAAFRMLWEREGRPGVPVLSSPR